MPKVGTSPLEVKTTSKFSPILEESSGEEQTVANIDSMDSMVFSASPNKAESSMEKQKKSPNKQHTRSSSSSPLHAKISVNNSNVGDATLKGISTMMIHKNRSTIIKVWKPIVDTNSKLPKDPK